MGAPGAPLQAAPTVLTVHWAGDAAAAAPSAAARRSLAEWALARGVHLREPSDEAAPTITPDVAIGDAVEELLERARDAITAQDAAGADAALARAEGLLDAHPELPEASWLLAEVLRTQGVRWRRLPPHDAEGERRSARAWGSAAALDGGRARGVGEGDPERTGSVAGTRAGERPAVTVEGARDGDAEVRIDGVAVGAGPRPEVVASGAEHAHAHQVTVTRRGDGALVWAGWVALDGSGRAHVSLPHAAACSSADLAGARLGALSVVADGVLCPEWVYVREAAEPARDGAIAVASCFADRCGPVLRWSVGPVAPVLPERRARGAAWPAWATWTIVGASAAAITVGTLAASGVFRPTHDEPAFTTGGLRVSSTPLPLRVGD